MAHGCQISGLDQGNVAESARQHSTAHTCADVGTPSSYAQQLGGLRRLPRRVTPRTCTHITRAATDLTTPVDPTKLWVANPLRMSQTFVVESAEPVERCHFGNHAGYGSADQHAENGVDGRGRHRAVRKADGVRLRQGGLKTAARLVGGITA